MKNKVGAPRKYDRKLIVTTLSVHPDDKQTLIEFARSLREKRSKKKKPTHPDVLK